MLLDNYPGSVALVQYHVGDAYSTLYALSRFAFYFGAEIPTALFDGVEERAGYQANLGEQYAWYLGAYQNRRALPTDVTLRATAQAVSGPTFRLSTRVCLEPTGTAKTVRVYVLQVLDDWPAGVPYRHNLYRQAAATEDVTLLPGQCQVVLREMTFDEVSWARQDHIRIIVWAQEPQDEGFPGDRAEVFQAAVAAWPFQPDCNGNGVPDADDLAGGTSVDVNGDGVPDECQFVYAGADLWTIAGTGATFFADWDPPIPEDFFEPASEPFGDDFALRGIPLTSTPAGLLGPADTVIERTEDAFLPQAGAQSTVPIRVRALAWESVQPVTVYVNGSLPQQWNVRMCLSDLPQPIGTMTIAKDCLVGGSYAATLPILPKFTFTRVSDGLQRTLDFGLDGRPPVVFGILDGKWVDAAYPSLGIWSCGPGVRVDANCDGALDAPLPGTTNFVPGIFPLACDQSRPAGEVGQRKRMMPYLGPVSILGLVPAQTGGSDSDGDGLVDDADNCPWAYNPYQEDGDWDSIGDACDNCPLHPNPYQQDCDWDGIGDLCALAGGLAEDCNSNGVPDSCDIAYGTSRDFNNTGIPDECERCPGDCNCDSSVGFADIDYFVVAIPNREEAWAGHYRAEFGVSPPCRFSNCDVNGNGHVGFDDIDQFVVLIPSACP